MKEQQKKQIKHKWLSTEYVILNYENKLVANFQTENEAIDYYEQNPNTTIYILKTFKY